MSRGKWAIVVVAPCVIVTVAAVAYAAGKANDVPEVIRAQKFELVDSEGQVRAVLQGLAGAGKVARPDGSVGTYPHSSWVDLTLFAEDGQQIALTVSEREGPTIHLLGKQGEVLWSAPQSPATRATKSRAGGCRFAVLRGRIGVPNTIAESDGRTLKKLGSI